MYVVTCGGVWQGVAVYDCIGCVCGRILLYMAAAYYCIWLHTAVNYVYMVCIWCVCGCTWLYMAVHGCIWVYMIEHGCNSAPLEGTRRPSRVHFRFNVERGCNSAPLEGTWGPSRVYL